MPYDRTTPVRPRRPFEPARPAPARSSALPDWMRNPQPPRETITGRALAPLGRLQVARRIQRRWWAWQERKRLDQRYPIGFKVVAFFASWIMALALLMMVFWLYGLDRI